MGKNTQKEARAPTSVNTCTRTLLYACEPGRDRQRRACLGCRDSDSKEAKLTKEGLALQFPKSPPLSVFLNDSEAAQYV